MESGFHVNCMYGRPLITQTDEQGSNWQVRELYAREDFVWIEQGSILAAAAIAWPANDCDALSVADILSAYPLLHEHMSAVISCDHTEDPFRYVISDHRRRNAAVGGTDIRGRPVAELAYQLHAVSCAVEYHECKVTGKPAFHHITQRFGGVRRNYRRIILPLRGRDGRVQELCVLSRGL